LALLFVSAPARSDDAAREKAFDQHVNPFLKSFCVRCHNADKMTSGVRVDHLDAKLEDRHLKLWEHTLKQVRTGIMPPEDAKPTIQNFRVDLGAGINAKPIPDNLILGAESTLLDKRDFTVEQLTSKKPFSFEPFVMRTKYRFIEGYQGNDTVRGWREYDSIY